MKKRIFISSVQKEFAQERQQLCNYIRQDALLGKYFIPFLFEELPATNQSTQQTYLSEVQKSDIYLAIVGIKYGFEDTEGVSPTEREFDEATKMNKYRICLIANPLYLAGYAERIGTGTADIIKQCLAIGLKPPTFTQTDHFRITFWRNVETLDENSETLTPNLETLTPNLENLTPLQGLPKRMTRPELEKLILTLCSHEYLTVNQISTLVGKSSDYLQNEIIPYMIANQKVIRLFPATPNHKNQSYKANIIKKSDKENFKRLTPNIDTMQVTVQVTVQVEELIKTFDKEMNRQEIQSKLNLFNRDNFRLNYLKPALEQGFIEMTIPEKPNSRLQKYRLTILGKQWKDKLSKLKNNNGRQGNM